MAENTNPNEGSGNAGGAGDGTENNKPTAGANGQENNQGQGNQGAGDGTTPGMIPQASYDAVAEKYRAQKAELDQIKADQAAAEKQQLEDAGKFKELAEKAETEKQVLVTQYDRDRKSNAIKVAALQANTVDADAVVALANLENVKVSEDGTVDPESIKTLVEELKTAKPYLFGEGAPNANIGNSGGGAPNNGGGGAPKFKRSQLQNHEFFKANEKEIMAAASAGLIEDDLTGKPFM